MSSEDEPFSSLSNDQSAKKDRLGFKPYVDALAEFLTDKQTATPLTISIEGDWGSGKSSFLDQLDERLEKKLSSQYRSVRFNPWRYSENETLWAAFAVEFEQQLRKKSGWWPKVKLFFQLDYKKFFIDFAFILIPITAELIFLKGKTLLPISLNDKAHMQSALNLGVGVTFLYPFIKLIPQFSKKISGKLIKLNLKEYQKKRPDYKSKIPFLNTFHEDLETLATSLVPKQCIYIFVDDLDRCQPGQAVELMQSINLMISDKMKAVFLLAMDRKKVAAGLALKNKDFLAILNKDETTDPISFGYEYIDKFIQLPFPLPKAKVDDIQQLIETLTQKRLEPVRKKAFEGLIAWGQKIYQIIFKRSLNAEDHFVSVSEGQSGFENPKAKARHISYAEAKSDICEVVTEISPLLNNNPRKIKKFLNILRFQIHLANQKALFGMKNRYSEGDEYKEISVYQLGKFLGCAYLWPDLISDWSKYNGLIKDLLDLSITLRMGKSLDAALDSCNRNFYNSDDDIEKHKKVLSRWLRHDYLPDFITPKKESEKECISNIPLSKMLEVCPAYQRWEETEETLIGKENSEDERILIDNTYYMMLSEIKNELTFKNPHAYPLTEEIMHDAYNMLEQDIPAEAIKSHIMNYLNRSIHGKSAEMPYETLKKSNFLKGNSFSD